MALTNYLIKSAGIDFHYPEGIQAFPENPTLFSKIYNEDIDIVYIDTVGWRYINGDNNLPLEFLVTITIQSRKTGEFEILDEIVGLDLSPGLL